MNVEMDTKFEKISTVISPTVVKPKKRKKPFILIQKGIKRFVDIIAGIIGIIILIPLTIGIYIARKILKEDDGPIFYEQLRIGKNGKYFRIYKYRSMVMNADKALEEYLRNNEEAKREYEVHKKLKNDPRVTKVGKFIRKTSIDELPQLINVLKGDMSLVGPRPYLQKEQEAIGRYYEDIIKCKPGITGLWQVSGRSETTFGKRVEMEADYVEKFSLFLDLKILLKTVKVVLCKEGAI